MEPSASSEISLSNHITEVLCELNPILVRVESIIRDIESKRKS